MELTAYQAQPEALASLAQSAATLLISGDIAPLVHAFGYALAFERDPAAALQADLAICLSELGATHLAAATPGPVKVSYFPAGSELFALAELVLPAEPRGSVLLELVVTSGGKHRYATLEQISAVA